MDAENLKACIHFTAVQAAQKVYAMPLQVNRRFTAVQAAQKYQRVTALQEGVFTAVQAAQKSVLAAWLGG